MVEESMHYYLIDIQYLGFRYHGFQIQPKLLTVQGMIDKTLFCIFSHRDFKTLGAGRTDAKVSANQGAFELFIEEFLDSEKLLADLNINLPPDIRALKVIEVKKGFQIINHSKMKEYQYFFSYGEKNHPFSAPFMVNFTAELDIELMKKGAKLFEGMHDFSKYCYKPEGNKEFVREVNHCEIKENDIYTASFFPARSFVLLVHGKGFLRKQVRMIMGNLYDLGSRKKTFDDILSSLEKNSDEEMATIAPASGLILESVLFDKTEVGEKNG